MNFKVSLLFIAILSISIGSTQNIHAGIVAPPAPKDNAPKTINTLMTDHPGKMNLKIRFVESFDTMRQCEQGTECGKDLEKIREQLSKGIQEDEQKLTRDMTEFQSKASTLSAAAREKEEKRLRKMKTDYDTKLQESEYEMKLAMQKRTEELAQDMEKAVIEVAKREKFDAVVDTVTGRVLYVDPTLNITDSVVKEMNTVHHKKLAAAKQVKADATVAANTKAAPKAAAAA
jgi:outer membrane protein